MHTKPCLKLKFRRETFRSRKTFPRISRIRVEYTGSQLIDFKISDGQEALGQIRILSATENCVTRLPEKKLLYTTHILFVLFSRPFYFT